ncbi:MAG: nicotinate-nicotinamide nucleotide adenylyltransferase [Spirochaetia bacterium]|nr:nicotinate-nicotinamide nucleotide adenylyltransferase [Spirochaetia bacterium]
MYDRIILGGSFDPPHAGHERMARLALEHTDRLSFLPANVSPFKAGSHASFQDRLEMVAILAARISQSTPGKKIDVLDLEGRRPPPSYTFETMRILRAEFPGTNIALALGSDSIASFHHWHEPAEILAHHPLLVFARKDDLNWPGSGESLVANWGARIESETRSIPPCASRQIRAAISAAINESMLHECLDNAVLGFIKVRGIYLNV